MKNYLLLALCLIPMCSNAGAAGDVAPVAAQPAQEQAAGTKEGSPKSGLSIGVMQRLDRARWISAGAKSRARVVYVFSDPECPYCNELWKKLQSVRAPEVQIRYLMVAVIDADSVGKAAAILESKDPAMALARHERHYADGGIAPLAIIQPATRATLAVNGDLMGALGIHGTPGLVYLNDRNEVAVFPGMPNPAQLKQIVGPRS
ncbi:MAG: thiol:disulfide interchange protein DsbG [Steroidobacteraceae bacterium]